MLWAELPRECNETGYLPACGTALNPAMGLKREREERRVASRTGQRNSVICF